MRKILIILAVVFQVAVLAFMAAKREFILRNGEIVYLRTAPIDPRDMFRGDYVRLQYEISTVAAAKMKMPLPDPQSRQEMILYAVLGRDENGLGTLQYLTDKKPEAGLFIKGRTTNDWRFRRGAGSVSVKYGIEAYFVQQGKGHAIEKKRGSRTEVQVPMEMEVSIGSDGTSIIKSYRWSPLGIGLQTLTQPARNRQEGPHSATMRLTLQNVADHPLGLALLPHDCSFALEPVAWAGKELFPDPSFCTDVEPADAEIKMLQPQEKYEQDFDFTLPRWQVIDSGIQVEIGTLEGSQQFRLVYRPPAISEDSDLVDRNEIWHGYLPSRAFHGRGNID